MGLLFKLLKSNINIWQVTGFLFVNLLGGVIVLSGVQACLDFRNFSEGEDALLSKGTLVVSKPVTAIGMVGSLLGNTQSFGKKEIENLSNLSSVSSVGKFVSANFEVQASVKLGDVFLKTDIFLEAVPDCYIKDGFSAVGNKKREWSASLSSDTVPIIIPRNYLNLYNYGFATSRGMPQISDNLLGMFPIKLYIWGNEGKVTYDAVVCGLTDKLNTILVPMDFLLRANDAYSNGGEIHPSRLIITTDAAEFDDSVLGYLKERGYVIEGDVSHVRLQSLVYGLIIVVISVGFVFSILAFVLLGISILLMLEKNKDKIHNLYCIGYSSDDISKVYRTMLVVFDVSAWILAAIVTSMLYPLFSDIMENASSFFVPSSLFWIWLVAIIMSFVFVLMHSAVLMRRVKRICH